MRKDPNSVYNFLAASIENSNDKVWKSWLNLKQQEWRDLVTLIRSDVRDEFKIRALAVLLVPHYSFLPFEWRDTSSLQNTLSLYYHEDMIKISELSGKLRAFTADLIFYCILEVRREWLDNNEVCWSLSYYNHYIIELLKTFPEDKRMALTLFNEYQLNDPLAYESMDDASGYNPLYTILNAEISEKWKRLAITRMHEIISAEVNGQSKPRVRHEEALACYLRMTMLPLLGNKGNVAYGVELFASQLEFVLGLPNIANRGLFENYYVGLILKIIKGDQYKDLRHRLARYVVLENKEEFKRFSIYDQRTKGTARTILAEFSFDPDLFVVLTTLLKKAEKRFQKNAEERSKESNKVKDVLQQMA